MEKSALMKRSCMAMAGLYPARFSCRASPSHIFSSRPFSRSFSRSVAMASLEDSGLRWQPVFRFDQADLLAEAPSLLRGCEDLDWKAKVSELRMLAKLSLRNSDIRNQNLTTISELRDIEESKSNENGDTWFAVGLTLATAALVQCTFHVSALAAEQSAEAAEAASRAPAWLTPALLAFPVVSYAIFNVYRAQVNPYAKVTDWMFGVAAVVIIANLVLISTIGVRLY